MIAQAIIQGRSIGPKEVDEILGLLAEHRDWNRTRLSRELCEAVVKVICELSAQVEPLKKKVGFLERKVAQLSKTSSNSSKPPSSDITKPKPDKGKKGKKGKRKIGAQAGHPKHERPPFPEQDINTFHDYHLNACPECNNPEVKFIDLPPRVIQQMEIKTILVSKEEHRSYPVWCEQCGKIHYHAFPSEVVKEGLFKERLTALVTYMKAVDHASFSTIRKFIRDVLGEKVSRGYLRKVIAKVSTALDAPYEELLKALPLDWSFAIFPTAEKPERQSRRHAQFFSLPLPPVGLRKKTCTFLALARSALSLIT